MCGSFLLMAEAKHLLVYYAVEHGVSVDYAPGDCFPSKYSPIIYKKEAMSLSLAQWGFAVSGRKGLIINARSETAAKKPLFKDSFYMRRCIIPANLFYEWRDEGGPGKVRYGIGVQDTDIISLGGIYKVTWDDTSKERRTFVILTTESLGAVKEIHSRTPLIVKQDQWDLWLDNTSPLDLVEDVIKSNALHRFSIERRNSESKITRRAPRDEQLTLF